MRMRKWLTIGNLETSENNEPNPPNAAPNVSGNSAKGPVISKLIFEISVTPIGIPMMVAAIPIKMAPLTLAKIKTSINTKPIIARMAGALAKSDNSGTTPNSMTLTLTNQVSRIRPSA